MVLNRLSRLAELRVGGPQVGQGVSFAAPVAAYEVLLDHNTDGIRETFQNVVVGEVTVPIDIVVAVGPGDLGATFVEAYIEWGYGGGGLGCFDVYGSIDYEPYLPLPDSGPFVNIIASLLMIASTAVTCERWRRRNARPWQFSLRSLLLLTAVTAILLYSYRSPTARLKPKTELQTAR